MGFQRSRADSERGASLVEFAILAPLLIVLTLGIVEFGWLFGQLNDVRHGAREGARFAAVDGGNNAAIRLYVCQAMDGLSAGMSDIRVELTDGGGDRGDIATIRVEADIEPLSGAPLITGFLPSDLESEIDFRLEQDVSWSSDLAGPVSVGSC